MNQLTQKTPDPSFGALPVTFTYFKSGQRQTMTDASGTTSYGYDGTGRLSQLYKPAGGLGYQYEPYCCTRAICSSP